MSRDLERYAFYAAKWFGMLGIFIVAICILLFLFVPEYKILAWLGVLGGGLTVLVTAGIVGSGFGFLFGIPRTIASATPDGENAQADAGSKEGFATNTNLEQISDWLTKALIGIGLVEAEAIAERFGDLAKYIAPIMATAAPEQRHIAIAGLLMIAGAGTGFLFGYMLTRTFLPLIFAVAQRDEKFLRLAEIVGGTKFVDADRRIAVDENTRAALEKIKTYAFGDMKTPEEKMLWGRAQFWAKKFDSAIQAFQAVAVEQPSNYEARRHLGWALVLTGKVPEGIGQLRDVVQIAEACKSDRTDRYRVDLAWGHLYLDGGFSTTIQLLEGLRNAAQWADDPRLNTYLAAAYGQSYAVTASPQDRERALSAVRRVVAVRDAHSWVNLLRSMLHPPAGSNDNDLAAFAGDEKFEELLGA